MEPAGGTGLLPLIFCVPLRGRVENFQIHEVQCRLWNGCAPADIVVDDSERGANYSVQSGL